MLNEDLFDLFSDIGLQLNIRLSVNFWSVYMLGWSPEASVEVPGTVSAQGYQVRI